MMQNLLGQLPTMPPPGNTTTTHIETSGGWSDPVAWGKFVEHTGLGTFFFVFITLVTAFFLWKWGSIIVDRLFGEKGIIERAWVGLSSFLEATKENQARITILFDTHVGKCDSIHSTGGPCNVVDVRNAGHEFAEMGREIGDKLGVDVGERADSIHRILRGVNQPPPVQGQG